MAQIPYDGGIPTVAPDVRAPDDTNPVRASAANFGGAIGAALEKAGEGIGQIADFHSQVVLDQAKTQLGEGDRYLLHGDPSKTTIGADGKPQPDVGFLNTNGRDTLDRQASVLQKREDLFTGIRKNLNPKEQLELDDYWRRYRLSGDQQIADKADQAQKVWATGVAQSASKNAIDDISVNADSNPARVEDAFHANREARIKEAQLTYGVNLPPEIRKNVIAGADRESLIAQTEAISVKNPVKAQSILDKNKAMAGPVYDELSAKFRERANRQTSIAEGQKALQAVASGTPAGPVSVTGVPAGTDVSKLPAGMKNNNPGNLKFTGAPNQRANYPGIVGPSQNTDQGSPQIVFRTAEDGMTAMGNLVLRKFDGGMKTVNALITTEGNSPETAGWTPKNTQAAANVAATMGISPDAPINLRDPKQLSSFMHALILQEHGHLSGSLYPQSLVDKGATRALSGGHPDMGDGTTPIEHPAAGPGGPRANFANVQNMGDPRTPGWEHQNLTTIGASNGQSWTVNKKAAAAFQGFLKDLEAEGYTPKSSGGYNYRTIRGAGQLSQHAFGTAIDIDAENNPMSYANSPFLSARGMKTNLPANVSELAHKWGLVWGGDWKNRKDPMHFEWAGGGAVGGGPQSSDVAGPGAPEASGTPAAPQVPGAPPPSMRANAYQAILNNPYLSPEVKQGAFTYINQALAAQQIAADEDAKAKKAANDQAADGIVKDMLLGHTQGIVERIANNPDLTWETRRALGDAAVQNSGDDTEKLKREGGPGYWNTYKAIFAEPDDPSRIADATEIWKRAGPDGDLTLKGAKDLVEIMTKSHKDPEQNSINTVKAGLYKNIESVLVRSQEPRWLGDKVQPDMKGQRIFTGKFIPAFEAGYANWVKAGKPPMDYLTEERAVKLADELYPRSQRNADRISADNAAAGIEAIPPAPANTNPAAWNTIVSNPPKAKDGNPIPMAAWAPYLQHLLDSPTQATIDQFNASQFGRAGMDGATILQQLQPAAAQTPAPVAPAATPPPAPVAAPAVQAPRFPRAGGGMPAPAPAAAPAAPAPPKPGHGGLEHPSRNPEPQKPADPQPMQPHTQSKTVGEILKEALPVLPRKVNPPRKPHAGEDVDPSKKTRK